MATQIKITQLSPINISNVTPNTLIPVVNTSGTAITQKSKLGELANTALVGAGSTFKPAAVANVAYSVANAAQPSITSVGVLTNLTVSGNVVLSTISNVSIGGGTNGYVLQTDGQGHLSWVAMAGTGNGSPAGSNTQVQFNNNGLFGGNAFFTFDETTGTLGSPNITAQNAIISNDLTTANLDVNGVLNAPNLSIGNIIANGNISANKFIGDGSLLTGITATAAGAGPNNSIQYNVDGVFVGSANLTFSSDTLNTTSITTGNLSVTGNANIQNIVMAGNISGGNRISANFLAGNGANITNVNAATANVANVANLANAIAVANVVGIGNIAVLSLDGNSGNVLYGNGHFANAQAIFWTNQPSANNSAGVAGQAAYDTGGNLFVCVAANTWAKFTGTTSW